jgi:3-oxoacyl-[acyl-carrier protein] reductase
MSDKVAVITGAGKGIGRATALKFAQEKINLALFTRTESDYELLKPEVEGFGVKYLAFTGDVGNEADVGEFAARVAEKFGHVDYLVNNAGVYNEEQIAETNVVEFDRVMSINVRGSYLMTRAFVPSMIEREDGVILFVSSIAGLIGFKGGTIYSASKFAMIGMAQSLMFELRDKGIRVCSICPGNVNTAMWEHDDGSRPIPETMIQPEQVAESIHHACTMPKNVIVKQIELRSTRTRYSEKKS